MTPAAFTAACREILDQAVGSEAASVDAAIVTLLWRYAYSNGCAQGLALLADAQEKAKGGPKR